MSTLTNQVKLMGRLGSRPEIVTFKDKFKLAKFSIATNENYKDKEGVWQTITQWHNIVAWGNVAESICKNSDKGLQIVIEGRLNSKTYESKSGEKRYYTEIETSKFQMIKSKKQKASSLDETPEDSIKNSTKKPIKKTVVKAVKVENKKTNRN